MKSLIKSILREEYNDEPQIGDILLCHNSDFGNGNFLTKNKTYKIIDRNFYDKNTEVVIIKDDINIERFFSIKPINGLSYKRWFHLLDNLKDEDFFPTMVESEEDDFGWADEIINKPLPRMWSTLPKVNDYIIFYFYPKINGEQFKKYVVPYLRDDDIFFRNPPDMISLDHLEIHPPERHPNPENKLAALYGNVDYFDTDKDGFIRILSEKDDKPINGRTYFKIED